MTMRFGDRFKAAVGNRRTQMAGAAVLSSLALVSVGVLAVVVAAKPQPAVAEMADQARLLVVTTERAPPQAMPAPQGRLDTLGADQIATADRPPEPLDPALQSMMAQEREEQRANAAEQRAFDARLKADMADTPIEAPDRPSEPPQAHGTTSNTQDAADS